MDLLKQSRLKRISELAQEELRQPEESPNGIGLSDREIRNYSLLTAIKKKYDSILNRSSFRDCLEAECHDTLVKRLGHPVSSGLFYVPSEIEHRDLTAGLASGGGCAIFSSASCVMIPGSAHNDLFPTQ